MAVVSTGITPSGVAQVSALVAARPPNGIRCDGPIRTTRLMLSRAGVNGA